MNDFEIRRILHPYLCKTNKKQRDTIIIDEFNLCSGLARIDIAVINGVIHGYEIKSEEDTLNRLPNQIKYYNKSLEKISIVINPIHVEKVLHEVPEWWGIIIIENNLNEFRTAEDNPEIESISLLQLLWKDELHSILEKYNIMYKRDLNKKKLGEIIACSLNTSIISQETRSLLKSRKNWRN